MKIIEKELSYRLVGALMEVHRRLGPGFREETYRRAVVAELRHQGIPHRTEVPIPIRYRGEVIDEYRLDLVVDGKIVLELKAVADFHPRFDAQVLSYLRASELRLGYLANFGREKLETKRVVL